MKESRKASLRH